MPTLSGIRVNVKQRCSLSNLPLTTSLCLLSGKLCIHSSTHLLPSNFFIFLPVTKMHFISMCSFSKTSHCISFHHRFHLRIVNVMYSSPAQEWQVYRGLLSGFLLVAPSIHLPPFSWFYERHHIYIVQGKIMGRVRISACISVL